MKFCAVIAAQAAVTAYFTAKKGEDTIHSALTCTAFFGILTKKYGAMLCTNMI